MVLLGAGELEPLQSAWTLLRVVPVPAGSLIGAHLSSSKEMTLQLMALSTILTSVLAFVFQTRVGARSPRSGDAQTTRHLRICMFSSHSHPIAGEWGHSMSLGHKVRGSLLFHTRRCCADSLCMSQVHFDANLVDSDVVVSDWRRWAAVQTLPAYSLLSSALRACRSFSGFKQAWDRCDGQVYNTSYASPLCEKVRG